MDKLADEIAQHLGTDERADIRAIEDWLLEGNDDGSGIAELADMFEMEVGLPSRR